MRKTDDKYTTNNQIVEKLYRDNYFKYITKSFKLTDEDKDDLISIVMVQLLEMNTEKLIDLYERDKLLSYVLNMLKLQYYSNYRSKFYRTIIMFKRNSNEINMNELYNCNKKEDSYE